jgi:hypothetical protein
MMVPTSSPSVFRMRMAVLQTTGHVLLIWLWVQQVCTRPLRAVHKCMQMPPVFLQ